MTITREGVIKFQLDFQPGPAPDSPLLRELNLWRATFRNLGLLGQDPDRYEGYGFGNLSRRVPIPHSNHFLISGTQTGHLQELKPSHYATVLECSPQRNSLKATGSIRPSSEALSHAILYQCAPEINWVMHLHSPDIFNRRGILGLPCTAPCAAYGTTEMALEIEALAKGHDHSTPGLLVMTGHQDGILAFGPSADETGHLVLETLALTRQRA